MNGVSARWGLIFCTYLFSPLPAQAQLTQTCPGTVTIGECLKRLMGENVVKEETVKATTGADLASGNVSSAIRDFLPRIAGAVLRPGLEEDRTGLALHFNQHIASATAQFGVELNKPGLYAPLLDSVPKSSRDATKDRLEKSLKDQDDLSATVALNWESQRLGRTFAPHRAAFSLLVAEIAKAGGVNDILALGSMNELDVTGKVLPARRADPACGGDGNAAHVQLDCYLPAFADSVRSALRTEAEGLLARRELRRGAMANAGLDAISALLNNQPQLNLSASYHYRDNLVGPREVKASLRYESSSRNLNWLGGKCPQLTPECFTPLMRDPETRDAIARAARVWFEGSFVYRPAHDIALPAELVALAEKRSFEANFGLGYGQYFGELAEGTSRPRIDMDGSYRHQLTGDVRTNRAIAKIAYTQPLSDALSGVFGVAWANKPEYLGEVQKAVSATLGLTYKLLQLDKEK